jgi:hypothetical protein
MIRDIELRFKIRMTPTGETHNESIVLRPEKILQWRKLVRNGPENNWAWSWELWSDVPMEDT